MSDLVERLRRVGSERQRTTAHDTPDHYLHVVAKISNADGLLMTEAAARIEQLEAALRPFAKAADCYDDGVRGSNMPRTGVWYGWKMGKGVEAELTVEDLRDARAALEDRT